MDAIWVGVSRHAVPKLGVDRSVLRRVWFFGASMWFAWFVGGWTLLGAPLWWPVPVGVGVFLVGWLLRWRPELVLLLALPILVIHYPWLTVGDGVWLVQTDWYALQTAEVERLVQELWLGPGALPPIPAEVVQAQLFTDPTAVSQWVAGHEPPLFVALLGEVVQMCGRGWP